MRREIWSFILTMTLMGVTFALWMLPTLTSSKLMAQSSNLPSCTYGCLTHSCPHPCVTDPALGLDCELPPGICRRILPDNGPFEKQCWYCPNTPRAHKHKQFSQSKRYDCDGDGNSDCWCEKRWNVHKCPPDSTAICVEEPCEEEEPIGPLP